MKELTNYINEKLDINKVNLAPERFKISKDFQKTIKFLKDNSFKELDDNKIEDWGDYFIEMNKKSAKIYAFSPNDNTDANDSLKFADTTKTEIGYNNPLFHILYDTEYENFEYQICYNSDEYKEVSKKVFLEKINQYLGF